METILTHVAGVDVHKDVLVITVLIGEANEKLQVHHLECRTFTEDLRECAKTLLGLGVRDVAMESTGIFWKPVYNVWHEMGLVITLGNASHVKNVPGRKTDVNDSHWIAKLHRNGLIRPSYIPESEFQELRLLTRHRTNLVGDIATLKNRVQKVLEDGNIKLGSVVSDVFGVAGLAVLDAICRRQTDTASLAAAIPDEIKKKIKKKEDIGKALTNCLREYHCFIIQQLMLQYFDLKKRLYEVEEQINLKTAKHAELIKKLDEIPGVDRTLAQKIIAEATTDMSVFANDKMFAAWAGVAAGNNESAQKKSAHEPGMAIPT
jgi:transposase